MTIHEAHEVLKKPRFGDERCIEAVHALELFAENDSSHLGLCDWGLGSAVASAREEALYEAADLAAERGHVELSEEIRDLIY